MAYENMQQDDFDRILRQRINDYGSPCSLLDIPGVYEIFADYFNNDVLEDWTEEQAILADIDG